MIEVFSAPLHTRNALHTPKCHALIFSLLPTEVHWAVHLEKKNIYFGFNFTIFTEIAISVYNIILTF